jgi:hypothetical protein
MLLGIIILQHASKDAQDAVFTIIAGVFLPFLTKIPITAVLVR